MERTRGVRDMLNTRPDEPYRKANYNLEDPKIGEIELGDPEDGVPLKKFHVQEIEHMEQKSFSGATWDPITANGSAATWISKHGKNITFFASNNDGMAEGAIKASNWYENMPIFGYDANASTLKLITQDRILGTIDSTTYAQCLACAILIRNIVEKHLATKGKIPEEFNPLQGINTKFGDDPDITYATGQMNSPIVPYVEDGNNAVLLKNRAIAKDGYRQEETGGEPIYPASDFFNPETGELLDSVGIYDKYEGDGGIKIDSTKFQKERLNIWQCWYNNADVFFTGNMNPYFDIVFGNSVKYKEKHPGETMFNINVKPGEGDGSDEKKLLDALDSALAAEKSAEEGKFDAFLINVVKQPNSMEYIKKIAAARGLEEKEKWEDRDETPIIFWNRQPTDRNGEISKDVMQNKYFKYTYYVGFDAHQGGDLQGQLIKLWLNKQYIEHYQKK